MSAHRVPLRLRGEAGHRVLDFPPIVIIVDGDSVSMLLDTCAETLLTPTAVAALHDGPAAFRPTSMISRSAFAQWHRQHPDRRVVDSAQVATHARMIRVPSVSIAGISTGPVWFAERSDGAYRRFISSMTDRPVKRSIGGDAFGGLEMTQDYRPSERLARVPITMPRYRPVSGRERLGALGLFMRS